MSSELDETLWDLHKSGRSIDNNWARDFNRAKRSIKLMVKQAYKQGNSDALMDISKATPTEVAERNKRIMESKQ